MGLESASVCSCVCLCVHLFTLSNMNITETSRLIEIEFHLENHWGGEKSVLDFRQARSELWFPRQLIGNLIKTRSTLTKSAGRSDIDP